MNRLKQHPAILIVLAVAIVVTLLMRFCAPDPKEVTKKQAKEAVGEVADSFGKKVDSLRVETDSLQMLLKSFKADTIVFQLDIDTLKGRAYVDARLNEVLREIRNNRRLGAYIATRQDELMKQHLIVLCRDPTGAAKNLKACNQEGR